MVRGSEKAFIGVKNSRDCHEEMNGEHYEEYIRYVKNFNELLKMNVANIYVIGLNALTTN